MLIHLLGDIIYQKVNHPLEDLIYSSIKWEILGDFESYDVDEVLKKVSGTVSTPCVESKFLCCDSHWGLLAMSLACDRQLMTSSESGMGVQRQIGAT